MSQLANGKDTSRSAMTATMLAQETAPTPPPSLNKQIVISGKAFASPLYNWMFQVSSTLVRHQSADESCQMQQTPVLKSQLQANETRMLH